ncbi:DUF6445 family protein [Allopontixanthobacter sp.]|uniref:DUF6445 family protein n=1 Tax=Allopontixanthobacter sp. TaxID=2906452 RepID=UPI002ABAD690|nr:DUF6445 family protein [Allopontixanthobacter sp.]MDZ4307841.1 DUF6445 family protein [Allopontixanthobacter sp.]
MTAKPHVKVIELPGADCPVAIIDGFATAPERWRQEAAGDNDGDGYAFRGDFYPGKRKPVGPAYFQDVGARLGMIVQSVFGCSRALKIDRALYSIVSTPDAQLSPAQRIPHIDDVATDSFAMVHYLAHSAFGGTAFYRHRSTGLARIPVHRHAEYLHSLEHDFAVHGHPRPDYIKGATSIFDQIFSVEFAFNRAIIYPGNLLHCSVVPGAIRHPDSPAIGRLTIAAFFRAS